MRGCQTMTRARKLCALCLTAISVLIGLNPASAKTLNVPVVYYKLPNGLKVVISEDHVAPVVTVSVYYNVGFRIEPKGRTGFAHLFEHMMFQGSANVKKFEHAKYVEANGGRDRKSVVEGKRVEVGGGRKSAK